MRGGAVEVLPLINFRDCSKRKALKPCGFSTFSAGLKGLLGPSGLTGRRR